MSARYTQRQVDRAFADAEAAAKAADVKDWDAFVLGFVSARLGVDLDRYTPAGAR